MTLPQESPYHVTPCVARGLGWWEQAYAGEPIPRFLVALLLGMTVGASILGMTVGGFPLRNDSQRFTPRKDSESFVPRSDSFELRPGYYGTPAPAAVN